VGRKNPNQLLLFLFAEASPDSSTNMVVGAANGFNRKPYGVGNSQRCDGNLCGKVFWPKGYKTIERF
jgi:hypothetical protein